ncbi:3',5'-cyclic AMP phosphodiesterase CpdA [Rhodopirellula rubra]|uniref:3',5'-cyclic AMP phosphodiesterase CpdA n=1 Tax=Aporhodopirellula rubra TaxID=980271 RepID=A0A7W5H4N5_9BACT|nr:metallophosphoesterase [Aporhodopirellula rubra]MBB3206587.1 3',5'-cyclic AMP phosphodiesterase CpdA [Aporhodopirellula rubra]
MLRRIESAEPTKTDASTETGTTAIEKRGGDTSRPKLAWITDPHFDHAKLETWRLWADELIAYSPDALVVTGDLSEGDDVAYQLRCMADTFDRPIYFVLGNHDFYGKSINETRRQIIDLTREVEHLHYLTDSAPISIADDAVLLGDDGWGDATVGDYANTTVRLHDFELINDFRDSPSETWQATLQREGRDSGDRLSIKLQSLPTTIKHALIATHVPPFRESCWYEGRTTDENWAPFFVCGGVGAALRKAAQANPHRMYTVLCGHTHHDGDAEILPNLIVHTGYSRYGTLDIESIIELTDDGFHVPRTFASST